MLYLDNAATTLRKPAQVYLSLLKNTLFGSVNAGRGGHSMSVRGTETIVNTQDEIAGLFNIDSPQNIAFTQNATYALNMAILGMLSEGGHCIVTEMEHNSVLRPVHRLGNFTVVKADKRGYISPENIVSAIKDDTRLIICTHASNVCGTIEPIKEIGEIAKRHNIPFLIDAAQTAGCINVDVKELNADFLVFSGHKGLMGPLGTGGIYVKNPSILEPIILGGTGSMSESLSQPHFMPDMLHSGTVNTPAIAALGAGVKYIKKHGVSEISEKEQFLAQRLENELWNMGGITVYGTRDRIGTTSFNIDGMASGETAQLLGKKFAVRAGFHCAPLAHKALGTLKTGVVRASFGIFNSEAEVLRFADAVWKLKKETI